MPELSEAEIDRWRGRLAYARKVWIEHGILGSDRPSTMRVLLELYRGDQWKHVSWENLGIDADELRVVNKVFPAANQIQAEIASRNPRVLVLPRSPASLQVLPAWEALLQYDVEEQDHIRQENAALRDHLFAQFGCVRHGFTPRKEFFAEGRGGKTRRLQTYRAARPDRPWIRRVAPWNVLMTPDAEAFHADGGLWWVAFRDLISLEDLRANPGYVYFDGIEELATAPPRELREMRTYEMEQAGTDPDQEKRVEVWTVYEARERTWFSITVAGPKKALRRQDDWPLPWESLPVNVLAVNEQPDTAFAVPLLEQIIPIQEEMNLLRTMTSRFVRQIRRIVGLNENLVAPETLRKLVDGDLVEFFSFHGDPQQAVKEITVGGFPGQDLILYGAQLDEDFRETIGQSKMGRAQRINVESATEAAGVLAGQDVATFRVEEAFHRFQQEVLTLYAQARRATLALTGPEVVRLVGETDAQGIQGFATVDPGAVGDDLDYGIEIGSSRRRTREQEIQRAGALLSISLQSPQIFQVAYFARRLAEAAGLDPSKALSRESLGAGQQMGEAALPVGGAPGQPAQAGAEFPGIDANLIAMLSGRGGNA